MAGSIQSTVILAKVETTSGTDAAPTNTADAVLIRVSGLAAKINQLMATRDIVRGSFGAPDMLPYTRRGEITFSVELAGSGVLGTAPQWGDLLIGCGYSETVTASTRVDYTPASQNLKTLTIWAYINGKIEKFNFCAGTVKLANFKVGQLPTLDFSFQGLVLSVAASAPPTPTLTAWIRAQAVGPLATSQILFGATYSAGAFAGGTGYNFNEFSADLANDVQDLELATAESVSIYGRNPSASLVADIGAAGIVTQYTNMNAGTPTSLALTHGSVAGNKVLVYAPSAVITGIDDNVQGNVMLNSMSFSLQPSASFNDELRLVAV
jgi:hypothetical protein